MKIKYPFITTGLYKALFGKTDGNLRYHFRLRRMKKYRCENCGYHPVWKVEEIKNLPVNK